MSKSLKTQWRVQVRKSKNHAWQSKGLFETRSVARERAARLRYQHNNGQWLVSGYGFGNTRVVPYVKGQK